VHVSSHYTVPPLGAGKEYTKSVVADLKQYLIEMEGRTVASPKAYVNERCELLETRLLTEFHKWASPVETRLRTHRAWFYEVDSEVDLLKHRIRKLEGGEN